MIKETTLRKNYFYKRIEDYGLVLDYQHSTKCLQKKAKYINLKTLLAFLLNKRLMSLCMKKTHIYKCNPIILYLYMIFIDYIYIKNLSFIYIGYITYIKNY